MKALLAGLSLLLAVHLHAGVTFGAVSPTAAGAPLLEFQPLVTATFYKVGAGAILAPSIDTLGGIRRAVLQAKHDRDVKAGKAEGQKHWSNR